MRTRMQLNLKENIMSRYLSRLLLIFLLLVSSATFAWNALGHMVIAQIAYENLQPAVKQKIDGLVNQFNYEYPDTKCFQQLAYWPDALRTQKIEAFTHWHYIDMPYRKDGKATKNLNDTDNALWALKQIYPVLAYERTNKYERARFLAFFVHVVSDLHQPLHTVSFMSDDHPDGDRGGNDYFVRYNNKRVKLHTLWDNGIEVFKASPTISNALLFSRLVTKHYPKEYFGEKVSVQETETWLQEGMHNAKTYVYATPENQHVSAAYVENAKKISEQQIALAGYRLAVLLNRIFA